MHSSITILIPSQTAVDAILGSRSKLDLVERRQEKVAPFSDHGARILQKGRLDVPIHRAESVVRGTSLPVHA